MRAQQIRHRASWRETVKIVGAWQGFVEYVTGEQQIDIGALTMHQMVGLRHVEQDHIAGMQNLADPISLAAQFAMLAQQKPVMVDLIPTDMEGLANGLVGAEGRVA